MSTARLGFTLLVAGASLVLASSTADAQKRQRDRITREEIDASPHRSLDLFQLIRNIRPHFLEAPKGVRSFGNSNAPYTPIALYVDARKETGLDALKLMSPLMVEEIRYYNQSRAESEFGPSAANGAVVVKLRKEPKPQLPPKPDSAPPRR